MARAECGSSLVEYVVLVAFLAVAVIVVLGDLGVQANAKLCLGTAERVNPDSNGNGRIDSLERYSMRAAYSSSAPDYDYNCNGVTETVGVGGPAADMAIAQGWFE